jgi:MMP 1-O-methyltransferase
MNPELLDLEANTLGWLLPGEGEMLADYARRSPGPIVEIGSYCGKSTIWIGDAAEHLVVSIDPHYGNPEMAPGQDCHHPDVWDDENGTIDTVRALRSTLRRAGLQDKVTVVCGYSLKVADWWTTPVGMVFIDGDHGPAAIDDFHAWQDFILPGGFLAFHDTAVPGVAIAVQHAKDEGWVELASVDGCLRVFTR